MIDAIEENLATLETLLASKYSVYVCKEIKEL